MNFKMSARIGHLSLRWASSSTPAAALVSRRWTSVAAARCYSTARKYTCDHEWVSVSDGVGTIGITDYAQKALGDVVFVELPAVGSVVKSHENLGAVESVKAASDIYAPVSGEVVEVNEALNDEPSLLNSSPYVKAWIAKIKLSEPSEVEKLLDEPEYAKLTAE